MKGRKFLKVTGILMIIGGAFGIIGGIVAMIGAGALAAVLETSAGGLMLASALILASAVFQLIAGIMGVKAAVFAAGMSFAFMVMMAAVYVRIIAEGSG